MADIEFDIDKVESLDFDNIRVQLQYIFKTDQDIANFINFLKNLQNFVNLSNDKRHMTLIDLGYFKSQIQLFERKVQTVIDRKKLALSKQAFKKAKLCGERITGDIVSYYTEDDNTLEGLEELHTLIVAWSAYMQDLYFMCGQTNKNLGNVYT